MHILQKKFKRMDRINTASDNRQSMLILSDDATFDVLAEQNPIDLIHININDVRELKTVHHRISNLASSGHSPIIINAVGYRDKHSHHDYQSVVGFLTWYFKLLKQLSLIKATVNLVSLSSPETVIATLMDGLALSYSQETSRLRYRSITTDMSVVDDFPANIATVLHGDHQQFLLSHRQLSALTVAPISSDVRAAYTPLRKGGRYMITGGTGGIGRLLSAWLTEQYDAKVFIIGRRPLDSALKQQLKEASAKTYLCADICDEKSLNDAWYYVDQHYGCLDAIFHLAGSISDQMFVSKNENACLATVEPKIATLLNLAKISEQLGAVPIINFASLSGLVGNIGQSDYAAANTFLTTFAERQPLSQQGAPQFYSLDWGLWDSDGMTMPDNSMLEAIKASEGFNAMRQVLSGGHASAIIFKGDIKVLGTLASVGKDNQGGNAHVIRHTQTPDAVSPEIDNKQLQQAVIAWLRELIDRYCKIPDVDPDTSLLSYGVDSVALITISSAIEARLKQLDSSAVLNKGVLFDYASLTALSGYLLSLHRKTLTALLISANTEGKTNNPADRQETKAKATHSTADSQPQATHSPAQHMVVDNAGDFHHNYRMDDVAIIGIAGEFPGADSVDELWQVLSNNRCTVTPIPKNRWDWKIDYDPSTRVKGKSYARHGGFIRRAKYFDPTFFNIAPVDAEKIDPQERRLLQTTYHALEDSGYFATSGNEGGNEVGVFVAAMFAHYQALDHPSEVVGNSFASIANRISYSLNFHGPSIALDTMCSGSLTALHLACNSIKNGECRQAVSGAVNLMTHPGKYRLLSQDKFLSPTGRCHPFGIEADGYVPGEGAVSVVLKKMDQALQDGDHIYAIIRGSAVNAGGRSGGFTVPSAKAQAQVIERAVDQAGIDWTAVDYVETHGTGTNLGDPLELQGLNLSYGKRRSGQCLIGSIKSNIGHLESAAGMAGLTKVILQMKHQTIVPTLFCEIENPHLHIEKTPFQLAKRATPWPTKGGSRFAAISSFGAGGSNGHIVIQDFQAKPAQLPGLSSYVLPVSAKSKMALKQKLLDLQTHIRELTDDDLYPLGYTLSRCRENFSIRRCFTVRRLVDLQQQLAAAIAEGDTDIEQDNARPASYLSGDNLNWAQMYPQSVKSSAPPYPFSEREYWSIAMVARPKETRPADNAILETAGIVETTTETPHFPARQSDTVLLAPQWVQTDRPMLIPLSSAAATWLLCSHDFARKHSESDKTGALYVVPGDTFATLSAQIIQIKLQDIAELEERLAALAKGRQFLYIINTWPFQAADIFHSRQAFSQALFNLAKALVPLELPTKLLYVSKYNTTTQAPSYLDQYGYAFNGLFRTLAMEQSRIKAAHLTLSGQLDESSSLINMLKAEAASIEADYQTVWLNGSTRYKQILQEIQAPQSDTMNFRHNGVYLISGGMGMIGMALANVLLQRWQARVILLGRSPLDDSKRHQLSELARQGGNIDYIAVDITQPAAVTTAINQILDRHGVIHGIIQSASILRDGLLSHKSRDDFQTVLNVKTEGSLNLDMATGHLTLDFFVMFSSMSSAFGNIGQADYVTANSFQDCFAQLRSHQVKSGERSGLSLAINWPLWIRDIGDIKDPKAEYRNLAHYLFKSWGIRPLTSSDGVELFLRLFSSFSGYTHQLCAFTGDRKKILEKISGATRSSTTTDKYGQIDHQAKKNSQPEQTDTGAIEKQLAQIISTLLKLPVKELDEQVSFGNLGFNSILLQTLAGEIEQAFGVIMPVNALFTYNTLEKLTDYVASESPVNRIVPLPANTDTASNHFTGEKRYAIIGMDGRLPGGHNLDDFWQGLLNNACAVKPVARWSEGQYYAATIPDIDHFDARFFGLSAREAMLMDPQHRLFLQTSYNTFVDAGYSPRELSAVGVFAGIQFNDYQILLQQWKKSTHPYAATGNAHAMLANRVSYMMDFNGPSQTIDTACSSALVAVNRGILALENGECQYALVGAVSLLIDNTVSDAAQSMGVLSPRYRCATFDAEADGYVRAEGVGCVLLKRYEDAVCDGDAIRAVIRSSAENHGGRANSLTAPNPEAQKQLLLRAYTPALASEVSFIETHGTGTKLGDPIEIDALKGAWKTLGNDRARQSIALGAVKSNIGHLEPAAGMASLLKVLLALEHQTLPANVNFTCKNPLIDLDDSPFELLTENRPWKSATPLTAGISSFGFGGSNAHLVLSQAPRLSTGTAANKPAYLVTLSARSATSLAQMRRQLLAYLNNPFPGLNNPAQSPGCLALENLAFTLNAGRDHFEYRLSWLVKDWPSLIQGVQQAKTADVQRVRPGKPDRQLPPLIANRDDYISHLTSWQQSYLAGNALDWNALHKSESRCRVHLPGYCFDTQAYWFESAADSDIIKEAKSA